MAGRFCVPIDTNLGKAALHHPTRVRCRGLEAKTPPGRERTFARQSETPDLNLKAPSAKGGVEALMKA